MVLSGMPVNDGFFVRRPRASTNTVDILTCVTMKLYIIDKIRHFRVSGASTVVLSRIAEQRSHREETVFDPIFFITHAARRREHKKADAVPA